MKSFCRVLILLAWAGLVLPPASAQAERPSPKTVLGFADWLYERGEYARAAGEYYRHLFLSPNKDGGAVLRKIALCYFKAGEYRQSLLAWESLLAQYPQSSLLEEAYYQSAYCSYKLGEYEASLTQIARLGEPETLKPPFLLLNGVVLLLNGDWLGARALLNRYGSAPDAPQADEALTLARLAEEGLTLPARSGLAAGLFSAVLPGTGKMYADRPEDGFISLFLCALLGGMAAYHFATEGTTSVPAWIYVTLGGIFYIGDIYGSVVAAEEYNERLKTNVRQRMESRAQSLFP